MNFEQLKNELDSYQNSNFMFGCTTDILPIKADNIDTILEEAEEFFHDTIMPRAIWKWLHTTGAGVNRDYFFDWLERCELEGWPMDGEDTALHVQKKLNNWETGHQGDYYDPVFTKPNEVYSHQLGLLANRKPSYVSLAKFKQELCVRILKEEV